MTRPAPRLARVAALAGITALVATWLACGSTTPPPPSDEGAASVPLWLAPSIALEVPPHARPHAPTPPDRIPLGPWRREGSMWVADNPIRPRGYYHFKPPEGMEVVAPDGTRLTHEYFRRNDPAYWTYDPDVVRLHGVEAPPTGPWILRYPKATAREAQLNQAASGRPPSTFVRTRVQVDDKEARTGLLLPAPSRIRFRVEVPIRPELRFVPGIVPPEVADGPASDGADVVVRVITPEATSTVYDAHVDGPSFTDVSVDLGAWAGQSVEVEIETRPGATPTFDYVFLGEPMITTRRGRPRTVALVFVDTLRPDHLGAYGATRDTSPALDAQARRGVVFTQARSVAPWTLPSARTMVTGRQPELYGDGPTLQGELSRAGFATAMFGGNLYLGSNFGMDRDWGLHHVELLPMAEDQLDLALAWLDEHEAHDALLLLHLMDPHLPYKEPPAYRSRWAGARPDRLPTDEPHRPHVIRARLRPGPEQDYIHARYDQNIRYADDQLARLFARLGPDDLVVFVSDHGEELWDHGGFEHGHSLYDELLKVPFVVVGPGLPPGTRVDAPVSLLDVTPTVLELLGMRVPAGVDGVALGPAMRGDPLALETLRARPQAFGRPLYGNEQWGSLVGTLKYQATTRQEHLFDLTADASETSDLYGRDPAMLTTAREGLGSALGCGVVEAFRIQARTTARPPEEPTTLEVTVPTGLRAVWVGEDPTSHSEVTLVHAPDAASFTATWEAPYRGSRDVWFVPTRPLPEAAVDLTVVARQGAQTETMDASTIRAGAFSRGPRSLLIGRIADRGWELGWAVTPLCTDGREGVQASDDELIEGLKEMGYLDGP